MLSTLMRTIIIGDVHGCREELEALLDRVAFTTGDQLVFVGDVVARGPDSLGVLDIVRRTGAVLVRGNHEQKLIEWHEEAALLLRGESPAPSPFPVGRLHRVLAQTLRPVDWTLLQTAPYSFDLPDHGARVVHGGVDPSVGWSNQDPGTILRIRTVRTATGERGKRDVLWGSVYNGPPQIVFGHNAAPGLQLHPWATGLDTGCVYGGRLTALVLAPGQKVPRDLVKRRAFLCSEPARRVWFAPAA